MIENFITEFCSHYRLTADKKEIKDFPKLPSVTSLIRKTLGEMGISFFTWSEKMEQKSIIIIGAGIAGLSAGCYGQMNGYSTKIFEIHDKPGGLCTSWKRKGYTIDGCLHFLVGYGLDIGLHRIWEELGAVQGRHMVNHEEFIRIEGEQGKVFILYTDIDRLGEHMKELAPQDKDVIDEFKALRTCTRFDLPVEKAPELYGPFDGLKMLFKMFPFLRIMMKWKKISIQDFAKRFTDPFLREAFPLAFDFPDFPIITVLMTLAWMHQKSAGYPIGGSLEFSRAIERRYLDLGGEIHYHSLPLTSGHTTIFDMLNGEYINNKIRGYYDNFPIFAPLVQVALGVNHSFEGLSHTLNWPLEKPITIAGRELKRFGVHVYNFDPTLAPPDKTVMKTVFPSDYEYWKSLKQS
jgi:hypothetical protein